MSDVRTPVETEPSWMRIARAEIGVCHHDGGPNARIREYLDVVDGHDGDNWCAGFAAWVLTKAGFTGPWTKAARSFLHVGEPLSEFRPGCIVVYWRESPDDWRGHVHFGVRAGGLMIGGIGGNQNGMVRMSTYPKRRLLAYRWPT